ncbi:hypothetical protein MKX07_006487 [Trichoderma sp. CBMAI-0711]|nr:hypothetical protein MKX07_006487 [Trichoderma sp. CBMAI-0711]
MPWRHSALTSSGMLSGGTPRTSCSRSGPSRMDEKSTPMQMPRVMAAAEKATPRPAACWKEMDGGILATLKSDETEYS